MVIRQQAKNIINKEERSAGVSSGSSDNGQQHQQAQDVEPAVVMQPVQRLCATDSATAAAADFAAGVAAAASHGLVTHKVIPYPAVNGMLCVA